MTEPLRAGATGALDPRVEVPRYDRSRVGAGVVHIGVGAFHRAHQAVYLDECLARGHAAWGVCGVGLRPGDRAVRDALRAQDGLYTLLTVTPDGVERARVVGSLVRYLYAPDDPDAVLAALADPATRIVSLTITEGGYGVDDVTGDFEPTDPATLADLAAAADGAGLGTPTSAFGFVVEALSRRRAAGVRPFTVLSCDNIQHNGEVARTAVTGFAARRDPGLASWIGDHVAFPSSMVDRITPATTDATRAAARAYGIEDRSPVRAESFVQWVVEDLFSDGRPPLDEVGVQLVSDVRPHEKMKLRLLNASHQAMGHLGLLSGATHVHEVCRDPAFAGFLRGYMREEAVPTLDPVPQVDVDDYCEQLLERFASEAIQDTLARQVVDSSDRMSKFLLPVVADQLEQGGSIRHCALVLAAWSRFLAGGTAVEPVDRRLADLRDALAREEESPGSFLDHRPVFGDLGADPTLRRCYVEARTALRELGPRGAVTALAAGEAGARGAG